MRFVLIPTFLAMAFAGQAGVIFSDNFNSGASPLWGNDYGAWTATGGVYDATYTNNAVPNSFSLLPFDLTDLTLDVDITQSYGDGGVWLHAEDDGGAVGVDGVLLVIRPYTGDLYWQDVSDGPDAGLDYGPVYGATTVSTGPHTVQVTVTGDVYSVFLDGSSAAASTVTFTDHPSGQVGLYDNLPCCTGTRTEEGFDNFSLGDPVPEPATCWMFAGAAALALARRRRD